MEMSDQNRRVTLRLTPYQARQVWRLRNEGVPDGRLLRTVTEVLILGMNKLYNETFPLNPGDTPERVIESTPDGPVES
jgi:hypothetical protein